MTLSLIFPTAKEESGTALWSVSDSCSFYRLTSPYSFKIYVALLTESSMFPTRKENTPSRVVTLSLKLSAELPGSFVLA